MAERSYGEGRRVVTVREDGPRDGAVAASSSCDTYMLYIHILIFNPKYYTRGQPLRSVLEAVSEASAQVRGAKGPDSPTSSRIGP